MGLAATKQEAFWEACGFGNKAKVRQFISEGINVNWVSYTHNSCPIHVASQGKIEIVQMLLDAKCKVDARDDRNNTALHHAAMKGHADIIQLLINYGAEVNAQDKNGWTPLINASYYCQPEAVRVLLRNNAGFDKQNKDSRTALHELCRSQSDNEEGLYEIVKMLIEAGSDINSKSSDIGEADFTPLMFCAYHGHPLVGDALIDAGCDINAQGSNKWTAMHWAADRNQLKVAEILLKAGLNPLIEGRRGELARDRARDNQIRDLLNQAVDGANIQQEALYHSDPSSQPQTNEAKLQRMRTSIIATAEDHRELIKQQEARDLHMTSVQNLSSNCSLSNTTPGSQSHPRASATNPARTAEANVADADQRSTGVANASTSGSPDSCRSLNDYDTTDIQSSRFHGLEEEMGEGREKGEGDGVGDDEDKDRANDVDPESKTKIIVADQLGGSLVSNGTVHVVTGDEAVVSA